MAYFGEGQGPIHLDNVDCNGTEKTLAECRKQDSGIHNCWHSEDAGVICDYAEKKRIGLKGTEYFITLLNFVGQVSYILLIRTSDRYKFLELICIVRGQEDTNASST